MTILFAPFAARQPQLNGSASPKDYPFAKELVSMLSSHNVIQVGVEGEEQLCDNFRKNPSFDEVSRLISESDTGICVDSYLQHHYWYLNKPAIVLFGVSDPLIFGHKIHRNLIRNRSFLRQNQFDLYYSNQHNPEAFVKPEEVLEALK